MTARTLLYVPGDQPAKLERALARDADGVIVDLEDAVALAAKDAARQAVVAWLETCDPGGAEVWIRVNPGEYGKRDVLALATAPRLHGLCLAKARGVGDVEAVGAVLDGLGSPLALMPLLETPGAILDARLIAAVRRAAQLQIGEVDLAAELGAEPADDGIELLWARSHVVAASAAAGIDPPLGAVSVDFRDDSRLRASTEALRRLGFRGRACIHPAQVPIVNEVFSPSAEQVAHARRVVERFAASGAGAFTGEDGTMVDEAVVRSARAVLRLAQDPQDRPNDRHLPEHRSTGPVP